MSFLVKLLKETYYGKTIARTLFNLKIAERVKNINGIIIDLGSGLNPSHKRFWQIKPEKLISVDIDKETKPDIIADLNKPLPFPDNFADSVFLFNVIYILGNPSITLREINRILKPGGKVFLTSPFIFNEAKEPVDYWRFTSGALEKLLKESGFEKYLIQPVGERFSAAAYLISPFLFFWPIKFLFYIVAVAFDEIIPEKLKLNQPSPIGYFVEATKR
ncbi:MAG: class I SAM-dependent methyltransferase [Patescibacteria group bacterium]